MKLAYVDSSCLVAIAFDEPDSKETARRLAGFGRLFSSNLLEAELRSALSREQVQGDCAPLLSWIGWVYPDRPLTREYRTLLDRGHARGADLWHLACALFLKSQLGSLAFVTLDLRQRDLARAVALDV
jgi:PIN domain nuclease of toxin-antitoxin system